jgi:hypothetical protein
MNDGVSIRDPLIRTGSSIDEEPSFYTEWIAKGRITRRWCRRRESQCLIKQTTAARGTPPRDAALDGQRGGFDEH